jgi:hydroxyethylthiazole kinase-like uncharacterized protein yjeF
VIEITKDFLRDNPLPQLEDTGDKKDRGRLLLIGGSPQMPGPIILAALAALRAGAGKVQVVTGDSIAPTVAGVLWEGRVFAMPETPAGGIAASAFDRILERTTRADAILIGPGLIDEQSLAPLVDHLLTHLEGKPLVLDAGALSLIVRAGSKRESRSDVLLTPHRGEMARLLKCPLGQIAKEPVEAVRQASATFKANVLLKGADTFLGATSGELYRYKGGNIGLATSGSGDALAGLIGGLLARGATIAQAAAYGVYVHAQAGARLARHLSPLGFLARELLPEFAKLLGELTGESSQ